MTMSTTRKDVQKAMSELTELGEAKPYNVGASHALPESILLEITEVAIRDRLIQYLLRVHLQEQGIVTDGETVDLKMVLTGEVQVTGSTAFNKDLAEVVGNGNGHKRKEK